MLIIKRLIATIIDCVISIIITFLLSWILSQSRIVLGHTQIISIVFCFSIFIPIFYLKNTIGYKVLSINVDSYKKLLGKYFVYYLLLSGLFEQMLQVVFIILSVNLTINIREILFDVSLCIQISIILIGFITFIFSWGKFNLLDFILNIKFNGICYNRSSELKLIYWFSTIYLTTFLSIYNYSFTKIIPSLYNERYNFLAYFPIEIFNEYSYFQFEIYDENNDIISPNVKKSYFCRPLLREKTIYANINKSTFESEAKRITLCYLLCHYSNINQIFSEIEAVDNTQIILSYDEPFLLLGRKTYTYRYYYENGYINGGIEIDKLDCFYRTHIDFFEKTVGQIKAINPDSVLYKIEKKELTSWKFSEIHKLFLAYQNDSLAPPKMLITARIPFQEVKPIVKIEASFPLYCYHAINFGDELFTLDVDMNYINYLKNDYIIIDELLQNLNTFYSQTIDSLTTSSPTPLRE